MKRLKRAPTAAMSTTRRIGLREKDTVPAACIVARLSCSVTNACMQTIIRNAAVTGMRIRADASEMEVLRMANAVRFNRKSQNEFSKMFHSLCDRHRNWQVWSDFITVAAIEIACSIDRTSDDAKSRMSEYKSIMEKYSPDERAKFADMFAQIVDGLEANPEQDFLGEMFMGLGLSNHWKGQVFTPYSVCHMIAAISIDAIADKAEQNGWASAVDPCCGAGALLIALRDEAVQKQIPPTSLLFVGQDIDRVAALMCFIQLSLLGCAGYVVVGDSISNPVCDMSPLLPAKKPGQEFWITPMSCDPVWQARRNAARMDQMFKK